MQKNTASQKLIVFAFDSTTSLPKSGDAANITAYVSKDYGAVTVLGDTSATEMDATNAKGYYLFDLTQTETNADTLLFSAKSVTSNIVVVGAPATVFTTAPNFNLTSIDSNGRLDIIKVAGTTQTAKDIGGAVPAVAAGASGGLLISGSNSGTTTLGALTVTGATTLAAVSGTTLTFSGAVAFQSTFAVTTSTSLAALSCTTLTASGAVAFQSTFGVTGAVTFSSTFATSGTTTFNAFTCTGTLTVSDGIVVTRSTSNSTAISATGSGSGHGANFTGGAAVTTTLGGHGVLMTGGAATTSAGGTAGAGLSTVGGAGAATTNAGGDGVDLTSGASAGAGSGNAATASGPVVLQGVSLTTLISSQGITITGSGRAAITLTGASGFAGLSITDGGSGNTGGVEITGRIGTKITATAGNALQIAAAGNGHAIQLAGLGSGHGFQSTGGTTGVGMKLVGGATSGEGLLVTTTSGNGITLTPTAGHGISSTANGTSKHGFLVVGGTAGTSDGFHATAGTGGVGFLVDTFTSTGVISNNGTTDVAQTGDSFARIGSAGVGLTAVALTGTQTFNNTGTWTGNIVGTLSTLTTYTGNTPQTGDSFARIGATGSGLTSLAPSATALSTGVWTAPPTGFLAATFPSGTVTNNTTTPSWYTAPGTAPTVSQIATAVWQDTTAGDFTTAGSIGKSLFTSGNAPGAASGLSLVGSSMDVSSIHSVSTSSVTTVNAVLGTATVGSTAAALSTAQTGITTLLVGVNLNPSQHVIVDSGTVTTVTTVTNQLTAAQIATGIWQDATAGDFTTSGSIGKSLYTGGFVPGDTLGGLVKNNGIATFSALVVAGSTSLNTLSISSTTTFNGAWTATNAGNNITGVSASVVSAVDANVISINNVSTSSVTDVNAVLGTATVGSTATALATVQTGVTTLLTGVNLNASQHVIVDSGTVTNLTNAPTSGDFTATMKTSLSAATPALSAAGNNAVADATLARNIAGGSSTGRTVSQAMQTIRNKVVISGNTLTVYAEDDTTPLYTATLASSAAVHPIISSSPTT